MGRTNPHGLHPYPQNGSISTIKDRLADTYAWVCNRITDELVIDIPNCLKIVDDVMFYGSTVDEVLEGLTKLMEKCRKQDFTLHPNKVSFGNKIKFAGHVISDNRGGSSIDLA